MKACPFCAESIQDAAVKCRYCSSDLSGSTSPPPISTQIPLSPAPPPDLPWPRSTAPSQIPPSTPVSTPAPKKEKAPSYWTAGRILLALIGAPALFLVVLILAPAWLAAGGVVKSHILPAPNFIISNVDSEGCGRMLDVCVRIKCDVMNAGDATGTVNVQMSYEPKGKKTITHTESANLKPGGKTTLTHEFPEAGIMDATPVVRCSIK